MAFSDEPQKSPSVAFCILDWQKPSQSCPDARRGDEAPSREGEWPAHTAEEHVGWEMLQPPRENNLPQFSSCELLPTYTALPAPPPNCSLAWEQSPVGHVPQVLLPKDSWLGFILTSLVRFKQQRLYQETEGLPKGGYFAFISICPVIISPPGFPFPAKQP